MRTGGAAAAVLALVLAGCGGDPAASPSAPTSAPSSPTTSPTTTPSNPFVEPEPSTDDPAYDPAYDAALSEPVEDGYYPDVGDPLVDALHYRLSLDWDPEERLLEGAERLTFRATADADEVPLELSEALRVRSVLVGEESVDFRQARGDALVVDTPVVADRRYVLTIEYAGTPEPVAAPTSRADVPALGWTTTPDGSAWTMQEPYGAFTWYAVNDQPSDKALYDFRLRSPAPMVGVANGELRYSGREGGDRVSGWHLAEPAASYLVTVAFDDLVSSQEESPSGVPVSVWLPREERSRLATLQADALDSLAWSEDVLGDYPFDTLGFLFVDSTSGMETQTMVTLGMTEYTLSMPVLVHEVVHQWWGDQVTPRDWRDLWMNEGMTMYLQAMWEAEHGGTPLEEQIAAWSAGGTSQRAEAGPPAAYDKQAFAEGNVYYLPAVLWHEVRSEVGDETFFRLVREWPASRDNANAGYDEIVGWWSREAGTDLAPLFADHLRGEDQPALG